MLKESDQVLSTNSQQKWSNSLEQHAAASRQLLARFVEFEGFLTSSRERKQKLRAIFRNLKVS